MLSSYSNLEYDLEKGERGERYSHIKESICKITGAEDAMVVNNNASAVLLILSTLAKGGRGCGIPGRTGGNWRKISYPGCLCRLRCRDAGSGNHQQNPLPGIMWKWSMKIPRPF